MTSHRTDLPRRAGSSARRRPFRAAPARTLAAALAWTLAFAAAPPADGQTAAPAVPAGPLPERYQIAVALDAGSRTLVGTAEVTFRNLGDAPVSELPFRLLPNAWSRTDTRWVRDAGRADDILDRGAEGAGFLAVDAVRGGDGADLGAACSIDETLMTVALPTPVAPGDEVSFTIDFRTRLPRVVARMGYVGDHVNAMQWFPKLCGMDEDGAFVAEPFREPSEFHGRFGEYDVSITVPADHVIGATGVRSAATEDAAAGTRTETYHAAPVIDFAWCASPHFVRHGETTGRGVGVELLSQPFLEPKAALILDAARFASERLDAWLFPYPYERVVIDAMPYGQGGGMEYPTLFTISADAPEAIAWLADRSREPSSVTIHEYVHQYFQAMVATDEVAAAWLDEGLTSYLTAKLMEEFWRDRGPAPAPRRGLPAVVADRVLWPLVNDDTHLARLVGHPRSVMLRDRASLLGFEVPDISGGGIDARFAARKSRYAAYAEAAVPATRAYDAARMDGGTAYRAFAYDKPALMLRTLEGLHGWDAVRELLGEYARRHAFRHPTTEDFLAVTAERLGADAREFVARCVETGDTVDWAVEAVRVFPAVGVGFTRQERPGDPVVAAFPARAAPRGLAARLRGAFDGGSTGGGAIGDGAEVATIAEGDGAEGATIAEVWVRNRGALAVPVELELRFADGRVERRTLDGSRRVHRVEVPASAARLISAEVDPDRRIALDLDVSNNARLAVPDPDPARAAGAAWQFWAQSLLSAIAWCS